MSRSSVIVTALAAAMLAAVPAHAQRVSRTATSLELTPYAGYMLAESFVSGPLGTSLGTASGPLYGGQVALPLAPGVALVGNVGYATADLEARAPLVGGVRFGESKAWVYDGGVRFSLPVLSGGVRPFVEFGAGGIRRDVSVAGITTRSTGFAYNAGAGVDLALLPNIGLQLMGRDYIGKFDFEEAVSLDVDSRTMHNIALSAGLKLAF